LPADIHTATRKSSETKLTVQKADADGVTFAAAAADDDDEVESDSCDVMHRGDCRVVCLQQQQRQLLQRRCRSVYSVDTQYTGCYVDRLRRVTIIAQDRRADRASECSR